MVLVRFGWIHTKFCSFALVVWHRLQQRKLIPAKHEEHNKKQKHNQNTESPKTTRQDPPEKTQQKQKKQKPFKKINQNLESDKFWLSCVFLVCFFLCALVCVFFKPLYSSCCSAQKPGIQKGSKQTPYSHFWLERKRRVKNVWKEGGTGPPLLRIHFLNFWVRYAD